VKRNFSFWSYIELSTLWIKIGVKSTQECLVKQPSCLPYRETNQIYSCLSNLNKIDTPYVRLYTFSLLLSSLTVTTNISNVTFYVNYLWGLANIDLAWSCLWWHTCIEASLRNRWLIFMLIGSSVIQYVNCPFPALVM